MSAAVFSLRFSVFQVCFLGRHVGISRTNLDAYRDAVWRKPDVLVMLSRWRDSGIFFAPSVLDGHRCRVNSQLLRVVSRLKKVVTTLFPSASQNFKEFKLRYVR